MSELKKLINRFFSLQVRLLQDGLLLQLHGRPHDEGEARALRRDGVHPRKVDVNANHHHHPTTFKRQQRQSK